MSYSIKQTSVSLTCEQMRAVIATLEAVRDARSLEHAQQVAVTTLAGMVQTGILSEHDFPYALHAESETDVEHWQRRATA